MWHLSNPKTPYCLAKQLVTETFTSNTEVDLWHTQLTPGIHLQYMHYTHLIHVRFLCDFTLKTSSQIELVQNKKTHVSRFATPASHL